MPDLEPTTPAVPVSPQASVNGAAAPPTSRPKPKGLLPVPPEVIVRVDAYLKSIEPDGWFAAPEQRQKFINDYTLQWHYGGDIVVMRETPQGYEVLASGGDVWEFLRSTPKDEKHGVVIFNPAVWEGIEIPWVIAQAYGT